VVNMYYSSLYPTTFKQTFLDDVKRIIRDKNIDELLDEPKKDNKENNE
jgi:hypothetical protein